MKQSIINWQTGEPKKEGTYLIQTKDGLCTEYLIEWNNIANGRLVKEYCWRQHNSCDVLAWCKLTDIEPYKEEEV